MKLIHKLLITNLIITLLLVLTMFGLNAITNKRMLNNVFEDIDNEAFNRIATEISQQYQQTGSIGMFIDSKALWYELINRNFHSSRLLFSPNNPKPREPGPFTQDGPPEKHMQNEAMPPPDDFGKPPSFDQAPEFDPSTEFNEPANFADMREPPPRNKPMADDFIPFEKRLSLLDAKGEILIAGNTETEVVNEQEITHNGDVVAVLQLHANRSHVSALTQHYLNTQINISFWTAGIGLLIALLFSYLLARHFTNPISQLKKGAKALAEREFETQITVNSSDEFATLADDFNRIATELRRFESQQSQWIMDISHELRTPLTILEGELEAINDGIIEPNQKAISSLQEEVALLSRLVNDLHKVSSLDRHSFNYHMEAIDFNALVALQAHKYAFKFQSKNITLNATLPEQTVMVLADQNRITQVLQNILENNLRYTDEQQKVWLDLTVSNHHVFLSIEDSGPGVPDEALEKLFDRLYRTDSSRNRKTGGFGLGLAICQTIVEAHQGKINATKSRLGGLCITLKLPLAEAH